MNGTNASTGQESGDGVPGHGHVNGDGVTLFDSHTLEDVGYAAHLTEKLSKGDFTTFTRFIGLVDDCSLFRGNIREFTIKDGKVRRMRSWMKLL